APRRASVRPRSRSPRCRAGPRRVRAGRRARAPPAPRTDGGHRRPGRRGDAGAGDRERHGVGRAGAAYASRVTTLDEWAGERDPLDGAPPPEPTAEPESLVVPMDTGERIHFLDWGAPDRPGAASAPILLVHELSQTGWSWAPVARR